MNFQEKVRDDRNANQVRYPHEVEPHIGEHEEAAEMALFPYRPTGWY